MNKYLFGLLVIALAAIAYAGFTYPKPYLGSAVGTTFNTAKIAAVNMTPSTASATSTGILNTDTSARWVQSSFVNCTGVGTSKTYLTGAGLAKLTFKAATSSVNTKGLNGNVHYVSNITVATSSKWSATASSTKPVLGSLGQYWPANTYLMFNFNATNTAACTVGVSYLAS